MQKKILETIQLLIVAIVLPLLGRTDLILTWPILFITAYGILLCMSQPSMSSKNESKKDDGYSMIAILIGALFCFIIPICDYAYGTSKEINLNQNSTRLGLTMIIAGFLFRYWSIQVLGKFFTAKVHIQSDHQLIKDKPYQWIRHPSYLGAWIAQLGISLFLQSKYGIVFCIFVYFPIYIYRIECEEKALKNTFPELYPAYQAKTFRMIPFVY